MPTAAERQRACRLRKSNAMAEADKQSAMELECQQKKTLDQEQEEVIWSKPSIWKWNVVYFHHYCLQVRVSQDDDIHWIEKIKCFILPQFHYMKTNHCPNGMPIDMPTHHSWLFEGPNPCLPLHPLAHCLPKHLVLHRGWLRASSSCPG